MMAKKRQATNNIFSSYFSNLFLFIFCHSLILTFNLHCNIKEKYEHMIVSFAALDSEKEKKGVSTI